MLKKILLHLILAQSINMFAMQQSLIKYERAQRGALITALASINTYTFAKQVAKDLSGDYGFLFFSFHPRFWMAGMTGTIAATSLVYTVKNYRKYTQLNKHLQE
jgi:hypothetical protein